MNFGVRSWLVYMLIEIMICCSLYSKLKSFRVISNMGCHGKSNVNRHLSVGTRKYSCNGICCLCGVTASVGVMVASAVVSVRMQS